MTSSDLVSIRFLLAHIVTLVTLVTLAMLVGLVVEPRRWRWSWNQNDINQCVPFFLTVAMNCDLSPGERLLGLGV